MPVVFIVSASALILQYFQKFFAYGSTTKIFTETKQTLVRETMISRQAAESTVFAKDAATAVASIATQKMQEKAAVSAPVAVQNITNMTSEYVLTPQVSTSTVTIPSPIWQNIALWFFVGAIFALMVYLVYNVMRKNVE